MKFTFADAFFWIALTNVRDASHVRAVSYARDSGLANVLTTDEVLTEYLNFFSEWDEHMRERAAQNLIDFRNSPGVRVEAQSRSSFDSGFALYQARLDKVYSLTDCISMSLMRKEGIFEVLTNDQHFEQEGFRAIFRQTN